MNFLRFLHSIYDELNIKVKYSRHYKKVTVSYLFKIPGDFHEFRVSTAASAFTSVKFSKTAGISTALL